MFLKRRDYFLGNAVMFEVCLVVDRSVWCQRGYILSSVI